MCLVQLEQVLLPKWPSIPFFLKKKIILVVRLVCRLILNSMCVHISCISSKVKTVEAYIEKKKNLLGPNKRPSKRGSCLARQLNNQVRGALRKVGYKCTPMLACLVRQTKSHSWTSHPSILREPDCSSRNPAKMAETILSMAKSMLGSAISKAAAAAAEEISLLMGVQKEIWYVCTITDFPVSCLTISVIQASFWKFYVLLHIDKHFQIVLSQIF